MRNWNTILKRHPKPQRRWLPDYLWGIETRSWSDTQNHSGDGFQTTYEELKLPVPSNPISDLGFQTTYEELKHLGLTQREIETLASRLPMRNWNWQRATFSSQSVCRLPDYLWGIETIPIWNRSTLGLLASRLPMRNWNYGQLLELFQLLASRLPMRNWNLHLSTV